MKILSYPVWVRSLLLFFSILYSLTLNGQSDNQGKKRVTGTYIVTNTTVYVSPDNLLENASVVIKNGLIHEVGRQIKVPAEAEVIDGEGLFVYPGFIDGGGKTGVSKPADPSKPGNFNPSNPPNDVAGFTPYLNVLDEYDPQSNAIESWRRLGFTMGQKIPLGGGMLPGKTAVVIYGESVSSNVITYNSGIYAKFRSVGGMYPATVLGMMAKWRDLYQNAELLQQHNFVFASQQGVARPEKDKVLEAFFPVINKEIPVLFEVSDELEIRRALKLQDEKGFDLVLMGLEEGYHLVPEIKKSGAKVILSLKLPEKKYPEVKPDSVDQETKQRIERIEASYLQSLQLPAALEKEGIDFAFSTKHLEKNDFSGSIQKMIENGLSEKAALAALTTNAAKILGLESMTGSIEKGRLGNLIIATKPIFDEDALVKYVFVDGYFFNYEVKNKESGKSTNTLKTDHWVYYAETPEGKSKGKMIIKKSENGYSGTITYDNPNGTDQLSTKMKNLIVKSNRMQFDFHVKGGGLDIIVQVKGDVSNDEFSGNLFIEGLENFPMKAKKINSP